jgi:hypothetical protein
VRPFKAAGTVAVLSERRLPVYAVVGDGFWFGRRLVDFLLNVHRLHGETEVIGPFTPPADDAAIADFVQSIRGRIVDRLRERRSSRDDGL